MIRQMQGGIGYIELILRSSEQDRLRQRRIRPNIREGFAKVRLPRFGQKHACRFSRIHHKRTGKEATLSQASLFCLIPKGRRLKGKILADFLTWMVDDGQKMTAELTYAPLPESVATKVRVRSSRCNSQSKDFGRRIITDLGDGRSRPFLLHSYVLY
jgi:ABC-type phosphate transport system substrate-binding protein